MSDTFNLNRFVQDQEVNYADAVAELRAGRKRSHWMWYVFPQLAGLGRSEMAQRYAVSGAAEASAYLAHPVLGPRLVECCEAVLGVEGKSAAAIMGSPDDVKLKSSATLFAAVSPPGSVFERVLAMYFGGEQCGRTTALLATQG